jgi:carbonic anhydrase
VIDHIRPNVKGLLDADLARNRDALIQHAVRANARASAGYLRNESEALRHLIQGDGLVVVGAEYSLETGAVDFFDGVPKPGQLPP